MRFLVITVLLLSLIVISDGIEVTGGDEVLIIGQEGSMASYDIHYRDPSQYDSPPVIITPPPPLPPHDNQTGLNWTTDLNRTRPYHFEMTSEVHGTGGYSQWRSIKDVTGLRAKHTSAATYGDLNLSDTLVLIGEEVDYTIQSNENSNLTLKEKIPTALLSMNSVEFFGIFYRERDTFWNNGDYIQNSFTSGAIRKDSTSVGTLDDILSRVNATSGETIEDSLYNKSTIYILDTRYVGASSFTARFPNLNCSEISEDYTGRIALNRRLMNEEKFCQPGSDEKWLSCCLNCSTKW